MNLPDFLSRGELGEVFLTGQRITLYHIVSDYQNGCSAEMLAACYPTLSLPHIHKVIAFYLENQAEVDALMGQTRAELAMQEAAGTRVNLAELRTRLEQRRNTETVQAPVAE